MGKNIWCGLPTITVTKATALGLAVNHGDL